MIRHDSPRTLPFLKFSISIFSRLEFLVVTIAHVFIFMRSRKASMSLKSFLPASFAFLWPPALCGLPCAACPRAGGGPRAGRVVGGGGGGGGFGGGRGGGGGVGQPCCLVGGCGVG